MIKNTFLVFNYCTEFDKFQISKGKYGSQRVKNKAEAKQRVNNKLKGMKCELNNNKRQRQREREKRNKKENVCVSLDSHQLFKSENSILW